MSGSCLTSCPDSFGTRTLFWTGTARHILITDGQCLSWQPFVVLLIPSKQTRTYKFIIRCYCCCSCGWGEIMSLNCGHQRTYCSSPRWNMSMESHDEIILTEENRRARRKTCPSATLSTINPTWTGPREDPGLRGERPATNRLNHGKAIEVRY
jgi:hypothetical protein